MRGILPLPQDDGKPILITLREAGRRCSLSPTTMGKLAREGAFASLHTSEYGGKGVRILAADLDRWIVESLRGGAFTEPVMGPRGGRK